MERVRRKAAIYGQDVEAAPAPVAGHGGGPEGPHARGALYKVSPDTIAMLYDKWVMPLTKQVQVEYLLRRLDP